MSFSANPRSFRFALAFVASAAIVGCSGRAQDAPKLAPVSGRVTYKGKAVEGATVAFHGPKAPRAASGRTDADGRYKLTMMNTNDGAVVGENVITISKPKPAAQQSTASVEIGGASYGQAMEAAAKTASTESDLPGKYASKEQSGLTRTVIEGPNEFNIDLE